MRNKILIVGGGISGLTLLHYLNVSHRSRHDVEITLIEKNNRAGGTIGSLGGDGYVFEKGPNGFLNSKPRTLSLVDDLDLHDRLVPARQEAKVRYIQSQGKLHPLPMGPRDFFAFPLMTFFEKARVLKEFFVSSKSNSAESVFEFGARRLGHRFSELFLDSMVSGIYGGDVRAMNMKFAFPRIYDLESKHGSLLRALIALKKTKHNRKDPIGVPKGTLMTFRNGMRELTDRLCDRYREQILFGKNVEKVFRQDTHYAVQASGKRFEANELYLCVPAYCLARITGDLSEDFAETLTRIHYAPIAVVGLVYKKSAIRNLPKGFGYLVPSRERKMILGVLFESQIFPNRSPDEEVLLRVMIGGARNPQVRSMKEPDIVDLAEKEIKHQFDPSQAPSRHFYAFWPQAIPQYDQSYAVLARSLEDRLQKFPGLNIVSNFWKGIALNDCVENAFNAAQRSSL